MLPLDFTWTAPDTCPTRAEVVEQLSKAVDAGGKELPPLSARAVVTREGGSWRLELETEVDGRRGARLLEADSCEGLARAATLVLALTLGEGLARRRAEEEARAAEPPPPPLPAPPPPALAEPLPPSPTSRQANGLAWLALGVASDPLGVLTPGLALGLGYQAGLLRVAASLSATLPRSSAFGASGAQVRSQAFSGGVAACLAPELPPLQLAACGEASVTLVAAAGERTEHNQSATLPLYGIGPSLGAEWKLSERAFVGVSVASRFYLRRPELIVEAAPERRRVEVASVSATLGGGIRW